MSKHILIFFFTYTFSILSVNKLSAQKIAIETLNNFDFQLGLADQKLSGFSTFGFAGSEIIYPDLWMSIDIDNSTFDTSLDSRDFIINIYEISKVATNGTTFGFRIQKPLAYDISVPALTINSNNQNGISGISDVLGGIENNNGSFMFRETESFIYILSKDGVMIPAEGHYKVGLSINRKTNIAVGTKQKIDIVLTPTANELNFKNNNARLSLSTVL